MSPVHQVLHNPFWISFTGSSQVHHRKFTCLSVGLFMAQKTPLCPICKWLPDVYVVARTLLSLLGTRGRYKRHQGHRTSNGATAATGTSETRPAEASRLASAEAALGGSGGRRDPLKGWGGRSLPQTTPQKEKRLFNHPINPIELEDLGLYAYYRIYSHPVCDAFPRLTRMPPFS